MAQAAAAEGGGGTVFELRVYHTYEGKLDDLLARFRDHTITIYKRHGMESVAYWTPTDEPLKGKTLFYIFGSIQAAKRRQRTGQRSMMILSGSR